MTLGRTTSRSAQAVTRLSAQSFVCLKIIEESFLGRWPSAFTCNDESYVSSFLVVIHVFVIQSGEGPTWCTPIKIQAPQGQVTLCSENFPESSLLRLWPLPLGVSFHDDLTSDKKMKKLLVLVLLVAYTAAGPTNVPVQSSQGLNCLEHDNDEFFSCMFVKTVTAINRAARSSDIEIASGITFVRDTPSKFL